MRVVRAYVINLRKRPDRLRRFFERLDACQWPFPRPEVFEAIEGDTVGTPSEFKEGGGAFGCRSSHVTILQRCLMDGASNVLILEDDADIPVDFGDRWARFSEAVPDDWEGLWIGGQHIQPPAAVSAGVVRCTDAERTHAYIARSRFMRALHERWAGSDVHIDWRMRNWQHQFRVYAPASDWAPSWLVGQDGDRSDIRGQVKPREWWDGSGATGGEQPVVLVRAPLAVAEQLRGLGFHGGYNRANGIDVGLIELFSTAVKPDDRPGKLAGWISMIQGECVATGALCMIYHPGVKIEMVKAAWKGPSVEISANSAPEAIAALPADWRENLARAQESLERKRYCVLLRGPRACAEMLNGRGFHLGRSRDYATGQDGGLNAIFDKPRESRGNDLRRWMLDVGREADDAGAVLTVWHPAATADELRAVTHRQVLVIDGETADEARSKFIYRGESREESAADEQSTNDRNSSGYVAPSSTSVEWLST